VAAGGIALDLLGAGQTTVAATTTTGTALPGASRVVTVTAPGITMNATGARVGSGLRYGVYTVSLAAPAPAGGLAVTLVSSSSAVLLLSPNDNSVGLPSLALTVPAGQSQANFNLHGVEGQTGSVTITASATGYTDGTSTVAVVPIAYELVSVPSTTTTLSLDIPFTVRVGAPNTGGNGFFDGADQVVRPGGPALTFTITNSASAVAQLTQTGGSGQSRTVSVLPLTSRSPGTVAAGGIALDLLGAGQTTVAATTTTGTALPGASRIVTVNP